MSGHNKWSKIHRQKSAADNKRGALFTKLANAITMAAKTGGGDIDTNFKLRLAVDQARSSSMPKDNIERAIKKGTGELEGGQIEQINYEGFGPAGTAFLIEALTDNKNRTSSALKHLLSKHGGSLGGPGSVGWLFEQKGIIRLEKINENLELELIDAGATDVLKNDEETIIYTSPSDLKNIKDFLDKKNIVINYAEVEQIPKETKTLNSEQKEKVIKIFNELDDNEDVSNFFTDADV